MIVHPVHRTCFETRLEAFTVQQSSRQGLLLHTIQQSHNFRITHSISGRIGCGVLIHYCPLLLILLCLLVVPILVESCPNRFCIHHCKRDKATLFRIVSSAASSKESWMLVSLDVAHNLFCSIISESANSILIFTDTKNTAFYVLCHRVFQVLCQ